MKLPVSWLRDFVDAPADARLVASRLESCGFEVAGIAGDVIDFEITANRPDCLSVYGLAREVATAFGLALREPPRAADSPGAPATAPIVPVTIESAQCGRYALTVAEVSVGPSPDWLATRLGAAGVRPINNVVDVTNYVMLEMGHPMHAFDGAKLAGPEIRVRTARAGERLTTLDGQARTLDATMLVIADRDRPVALAGLMGGAATEVSATTSRIALESAWFQPTIVRAMSRRLGLKTEASARFERGADIDAPVRAIERALALFARIGGVRPTGPVVDVYPHPAVGRAVDLERAHVTRLAGVAIPDADIERILTGLGFGVTPTPTGWRVLIPTYRVDVTREVDLIEDVSRHWGFDRIPATFPPLRSTPPPSDPLVLGERMIRRVLCGAGLQEAVTFTFIEEAAAVPFAAAAPAAGGQASDGALVAIANPLSEKFAVLRPSLLPGLLDALVYSRRRETADVRLFEVGSVFGPAGERHRAGWVLTGARGDHWSGGTMPVDLFDAKGIAELLGRACGMDVDAVATDEWPWFVPGRAARLVQMSRPNPIGWGLIGQIRPDLALKRGLGQPEAVFGGEIDLGLLLRAEPAAAPPLSPLPRFPSIVRDLSILVDERLPAAAVRGTIRARAPAILVAVREFDRYQGKGVPAGQVSLSVRLTFRDTDRTLTDSEVQHAVDAIVAALVREHGATLRGAARAE